MMYLLNFTIITGSIVSTALLTAPTVTATAIRAASEATFVAPRSPGRRHDRLVKSAGHPNAFVLFSDSSGADRRLNSGGSRTDTGSNQRNSLNDLLHNALLPVQSNRNGTGSRTESIDDITDRIASRIALPFLVPIPVVKAATRVAVYAMTTDLSPDLMERIGDAVAVSTEDANTAGEDELRGVSDELVTEVASELNAVVNLPLLNEDQELVVIRAVVWATLNFLAFPDLDDFFDSVIPHDPKEAVTSAVDVARGLLSGPEGRVKIVRALNQRVDFPFLDENSERVLLEKALEVVAEGLDRALPAALAEVLSTGIEAEKLEETKQFVSDVVNARIDIPGLNEEQEGWIIWNVVDIIIDLLVGDTDADLLIMDLDERKQTLLGRRKELMAQVESIDEKLTSLAKLENNKLKIKELELKIIELQLENDEIKLENNV